jgi:hypothetical protein
MKMNSYDIHLLKRLSLALALLFIISFTTVNAQEEATEETETEAAKSDSTSKDEGFFQKLQWGPKAGLTISNFYTDRRWMGDNMPGFTVGAQFMYPVNDMIDFGIELLYAHQGAKNVNTSTFYTPDQLEIYGMAAETDVILHTLEVPVLFTFDLPAGANPSVIPQFSVGHSFGMNLHAQTYAFGEENGFDDISEKVQFQNFALLAGFGLEIIQTRRHLKPLVFNLDFRYRLGYTNLNNFVSFSKNNVDPVNDYNNNFFAITLGMKL